MEWEQRREPQLIEQIQIDPERGRVLKSLTEVGGNRDVGKFLVAGLLNNEIDVVINMGEPALGKTTITQQLIDQTQANAHRLGKNLEIETVFYDDFLKKDEEGGKEWNDTYAFNMAIVNKAREIRKNSPQTKLFIEIPAVGFTAETKPPGLVPKYKDVPFIKDRGQAAFLEFVEDYKKGEKIQFVRSIRNEAMQKIGIAVRERISKTPANNVIPELSRLGYEVVGVNSEDEGELVKSVMGAMARGYHIEHIQYEENMLATSVNADDFPGQNYDFDINIDDVKRFYQILGDSKLSEEILLQISYDQEIIKSGAKLQATYIDSKFGQLGIKESSLMVFNNYTPETVTIDMSRLIAAQRSRRAA